MGLLLALLHQPHLSVGNHSHHSTVLLDSSQITIDLLFAKFVRPLLGILGESLLLRLVPRLLFEEQTKSIDGDNEWPHRIVG